MQAPSPPPTPNPYAVAAAQTASNVETAIANTALQNSDVDTPQGSLRYTIKSTHKLVIITRDKDGNVTGQETKDVPRFLRTETLAPKTQAIFDRNQDTQFEMSDWALLQTQALKRVHSTPFSLAGLPSAGLAPAIQPLDGTLPAPGIIRTSLPTASAEATRQRALDALTARTDFLMGRDRQAMIVKLANQGIVAGTLAYLREMEVFDQGLNDARNRDYLAAGQEATREFQVDFQAATFANAAQGQAFQQSVLIQEFSNGVALKRFTMLHSVADFVNVLRERALQERIQERGQTVNEITALLHGGQVSMPQFAPFKGGNISDTPVGQYVYQSAALDMQKWQVQTQNQQQMMGGMMGLAGNLIGAGMTGGAGGSLFGKLFGM